MSNENVLNESLLETINVRVIKLDEKYPRKSNCKNTNCNSQCSNSILHTTDYDKELNAVNVINFTDISTLIIFTPHSCYLSSSCKTGSLQSKLCTYFVFRLSIYMFYEKEMIILKKYYIVYWLWFSYIWIVYSRSISVFKSWYFLETRETHLPQKVYQSELTSMNMLISFDNFQPTIHYLVQL